MPSPTGQHVSERARPGKDASADEIAADIEQTREHLGATVDALTNKLDVKSRAQDKVADARDRAATQVDAVKAQGARLVVQARDAATEDDGSTKPVVPIAAGLLGAGMAVLAITAWRRAR